MLEPAKAVKSSVSGNAVLNTDPIARSSINNKLYMDSRPLEPLICAVGLFDTHFAGKAIHRPSRFLICSHGYPCSGFSVYSVPGRIKMGDYGCTTFFAFGKVNGCFNLRKH